MLIWFEKANFLQNSCLSDVAAEIIEEFGRQPHDAARVQIDEHPQRARPRHLFPIALAGDPVMADSVSTQRIPQSV